VRNSISRSTRLSIARIPLAACGLLGLAWVLPAPAADPSEAASPTTTQVDCRYAGNEEAAQPAETSEWRRFPSDDLFRPLLADPKQTQFVISRQRVKPDGSGDLAGGLVVYGENFGMYRYRGRRACDGVQVNIQGGVFSLFNLSAPSWDLINADYVVGIPVTFRRTAVSGRFRLYHLSSHLGDEFLLGTPGITRVNLSFEEAELLLSADWRGIRVYGGGGLLIHREPDLARGRWQYGLEGRRRLSVVPGLGPLSSLDFLVFGVDVKALQQHDYHRDVSLKAGFELASETWVRRFRLLLNYYNGFTPHGQFYDFKMHAVGAEVNFGF
jgi:hypothetical protein